MKNKQMKKASSALLLISALLHTCVASQQNIAGENPKQTSINGFLRLEFKDEKQAAGLEASLYYPMTLSYNTLSADAPAKAAPRPGLSYTGRGCLMIYGCRTGT